MEIASFGGETVSNSYYTEGTGKIKAKIANLNPILETGEERVALRGESG